MPRTIKAKNIERRNGLKKRDDCKASDFASTVCDKVVELFLESEPGLISLTFRKLLPEFIDAELTKAGVLMGRQLVSLVRSGPLESAKIDVHPAGELPEDTPYHAKMAETICEANEPVRIHPGDETMCMTFFVALHAAITKGHGEKPGEAVSYAKAVVRAAREVFE